MLIYIQSLLLFLTSATAVSLFGVRLSDLSVVLFFLFLLPHIKSISPRIPIFIFLLLVLLPVVVSTFCLLLFRGSLLSGGFSNAVAIPLGILISLFFAWLFDLQRALRFVSAYARLAAFLSFGFLAWHILVGVPGWVAYEDEFDRFSALSQNPNQLALYLLPIPFFSIFAWAKGGKTYGEMVFEIILVLVVNGFVLGKALFIGWGVSFTFLFIIGFSFFGKIRLSGVSVCFRVLLCCVAFSFVFPVFNALYEGRGQGSQEGQGGVRVALWQHGLDAWYEAPFLGHGPGHYSGLDLPFQGMEAHNFLIDWLSAYGLFGGIFLIMYFLWLFLLSARRQVWIVVALYLVLFVQVMFHFYGRQPIFWIILSLGYILSSRGGAGKQIAVKCS